MNVPLLIVAIGLGLGGMALSIYLFGRLPSPSTTPVWNWIEAALPGFVGVVMGFVVARFGKQRVLSQPTTEPSQSPETPNRALDTNENAALKALLEEYDASNYVPPPGSENFPESQRCFHTGHPIPAALLLENRPPIVSGSVLLDPIIFLADDDDEPIRPPNWKDPEMVETSSSASTTRRLPVSASHRPGAEDTPKEPYIGADTTRKVLTETTPVDPDEVDTDEFAAPQFEKPTDEYDFQTPTRKLGPEDIARLQLDTKGGES